MTHVWTSTGIGRMIGAAVVLMTLMGATEAPAQSSTDGTASGTFVFTLAEGSGFLYLSADGSAEMALIPGHGTCETCQIPGRILTGTHRTPRLDNGQCLFLMNLVDPGREPRNIEIHAVAGLLDGTGWGEESMPSRSFDEQQPHALGLHVAREPRGAADHGHVAAAN